MSAGLGPFYLKFAAEVRMTSYGGMRSESEIVDEIRRRMRRYAANVIYIFRDGASSLFLRR